MGDHMKIATIVGARPQFVKAAVVSRAIAACDDVDEILIHTGQHYDLNMSDIFFQEMRIPRPAHHLGISGGPHGQMTGRQLEAIEHVLMNELPDLVMVYGDTNSTVAGALAAAKLHIPVAHVEAGLRSHNKRMPEEINRIVTDHVSDFLLAPSEMAMFNLQREGLAEKASFVGDVMYDAALLYGDEAELNSKILEDMGLEKGGFRLATVHRAENTDDPRRLNAIFEALRLLAAEARLVLPLHPRTRKKLENMGNIASLTAGIDVIEPVGVFDIIRLLRGARLVLTDSGGMQKESYFHGTPVVILREETEWTELLDIGWASLVPQAVAQCILNSACAMEKATNRQIKNPYGTGDAAFRILKLLVH